MASHAGMARIGWAVLTCTAAASCGGDSLTTPSGKGAIDMQIALPGGRTDGIVMVRVNGDLITSANAVPGVEVKAIGLNSTDVLLVLRGPFQGTPTVARLCLPRVERRSEYQFEVVQAAAGASGGYAKRSDTGAYSAGFVEGTRSRC